MIGFVTSKLGRLLIVLAVLSPAWAQDPTSRVTNEILKSRILAAEGSKEIDDSTRARLVKLYQQSLSNLEANRSNEKEIEEYRRAMQEAPIQVESIRASIARMRGSNPTKGLRLGPILGTEDLIRNLEDELAQLAAAQGRKGALDRRLDGELDRRIEARERITAARIRIDEISDARESADGELPLFSEAARWLRETGIQALQSEIAKLDRELISQPARVRLLRVQQEAAALEVSRLTQRADAIRSALNKRRLSEAKEAVARARAALGGPSAKFRAVRDLAKSNLDLAELLAKQAADSEGLSQREAGLRPQLADLSQAIRTTQRKLQLDDSDAPLGLAIRELRAHLTDAKVYEWKRGGLQRSIARVSLRIIENEDERGSLDSPGEYVDKRIEAEGEILPVEGRLELELMAGARASLLDRAIANDTQHRRRLYALDELYRQLADRTTDFDKFLGERLLWVRSTPAVSADTFKALPEEVIRYLSPAAWIKTGRAAADNLFPGPLVGLLVALFLLVRRKRLRRALAARSENVGRVTQDSMAATISALGLTLLLMIPLPLILCSLSRALWMASDAGEFASGVGVALEKSAYTLLLLMLFRWMFARDGVVDCHFDVDAKLLAELRRKLFWVIAIGMPLMFLATSAEAIDRANQGGSLGLLAFIALEAGLIFAVWALFNPARGTARSYLASRKGSRLWSWRYVWFAGLLALPATAIALALAGYTHTSVEIAERMMGTLWLATAVWIVRRLAKRWLLTTRRRLVYEAAIKAHEASLATKTEQPAGSADEGGDLGDIGAPEVDIVALDSDSRRLLNAAMFLVLAVGLLGIWGEIFPALGVLDEIEFWNKTVLVGGVPTPTPVSLADVLLAVAVAFGGYLAARNLPSLIDIVLLKRGNASDGTRYAVTTLARYTIVAAAVLIPLGMLGASWSQLGWAAAALGVGIGFGLQEIVANFICGLILLFERPIRVGDVITIGDASGTVTRIRIRATTIRNWDRMELIVPNKELITGRLLNWTLTDAVTRVAIPVGVAYGSDVAKATDLLLEAARENELVLDDPAPSVVFDAFADSSLSLQLRVFVRQLLDRLPAKTELHNAIDSKYRAAGIVIAFPQRDVHHYSEPPRNPDPDPDDNR